MSKYALQVILQPVTEEESATVLVERMYDDIASARQFGKSFIQQMCESTQQRCIFYVIPVIDEYRVKF